MVSACLPAAYFDLAQKEAKQVLNSRHLFRVRRVADWMVGTLSAKWACARTGNRAKSLRDVRQLVAELENFVHGPLDVCASHQVNYQIQVIERFVYVGP